MLKRNIPLRCRVVDRVLTIEIGISTLKGAAEQHDSFWQPATDKCSLVVDDADLFARAVRAELLREGEDGSTPVRRMLDAAISEAVEQGADGVDFDAMEVIQKAECSANDGSDEHKSEPEYQARMAWAMDIVKNTKV